MRANHVWMALISMFDVMARKWEDARSVLLPGANPAGNMPTAMNVGNVTICQNHLHRPGPLRREQAWPTLTP
jgi:hypothetical protein